MWQQTSLLTGVSNEQRRTKVKECLHHMGMSLRAPFIYTCLTMRGVIELPSKTSDNEETVHGARQCDRLSFAGNGTSK